MLKLPIILSAFLGVILIPLQLSAQSWSWGRGVSGSGTDGWPVATDPSGNVFMGAVNFGGVPVSFGAYSLAVAGAGYQVVVAKYDPSGSFLWAFGTQNGDGCLVNIATDPGGNLFILGAINDVSIQVGSITVTNTAYPNVQYFLAKLDPAGNVLWAKSGGENQGSFYSVYLMYGVTRICGTGGIAVDGAGNAYITSNFSAPTVTVGATTLTNTDPSGNTDDILIAKYDPSGNVAWAKSAGGSLSDDAYGITVTPAGDVYIAGVFASSSVTFGPSVITNTAAANAQIAFIARYNASGSPTWASSSGGQGGEYAAGLASDVSNNVYMTGGLCDAGISFGGATIADPYPGKPVLYLIKFAPSNSVLWYRTIGAATDSTWGYCIATSTCGDIWVSGAMTGSVNIDSQVLAVPPGTVEPVFVAGFDANGNVTGYSALPSGGDDQTGIACDAIGNVFLCSDYQATPAGFFSVGTDTLADIGAVGAFEWLYVGKYPARQNSLEVKHSFTSLCLDQKLVLEATTGYTNYTWSDGHTGTADTVKDSGLYWVNGTLSCTALSTDSFKVSDCGCSQSLFVPNAFTPNGDGQDDVFYPRSGSGILLIKSFRVYDRWGTLLFERDNTSPNDKTNAWDGTYQGDKPHTDVYVWVVDAECEDGLVFHKKGNVTIIR